MKFKFIVILILVTLTSCDKSFIELAPEDQQSSNTFFKNETLFRQAVTAAYPPLRDLLTNEYFLAEMRTDNTHYDYAGIHLGSANVEKRAVADFINDPNNRYTRAVYVHCYRGISRANIVLDRIQSADIDQGAKDNIEGQAQFLRALYYFKLVTYFGGVPLHLHEVETVDEAFYPRATADEVYGQIEMDCREAIAKLDPPANFPQTGEATKGAATMLLAEGYMSRKKYAEAETLLKTLPGMGYKLLASYSDVFSTANKNSSESIFEVQYREGAQGGQQSNFIYLFLPSSHDTSIITGVATNNGGGYNVPTRDMIDSYEEGDSRKDASIGIAEGTYDQSHVFKISANKSIVDYTPADGKEGVPFIKKYLNPHSLPNNTDDDWPIYRYADALLLLSEALNEQGKSGEALTFLNQIRDRAFGAGVSPVTTTDQNALRKTILHERRVELAFENHRWLDLLRSGKAVEIMNAYGAKLKGQYGYLLPGSYNVTQDKLLYPIPQSEIDLDPELTQNPGY